MRDGARHKSVFRMWSHLDAQLRAEMTGTGLWLDTSAMTVSETVRQILARCDDAVVAD